MQRCAEVCGGTQRGVWEVCRGTQVCRGVHRGTRRGAWRYAEGSTEVHRGTQRYAEGYTEVRRGVCRGMQRGVTPIIQVVWRGVTPIIQVVWTGVTPIRLCRGMSLQLIRLVNANDFIGCSGDT